MSTGQIVGGLVGAVIGFFSGGPAGAFYGAAIGAGIGSFLMPPKGPNMRGPRLEDSTWQKSSYGGNLNRLYGTSAMSGNVFYLENGKFKEVAKKSKSGGKGGGGSSGTTTTYTYYATFALGLCVGARDGETIAVRRIWCADKLIYNAASDDLQTIVASNQNAKGWKLYQGRKDQMPDPRMEGKVGVGRTPGYRNLCYLMFYDFKLTDYSNMLQAAQFKVELVKRAADVPMQLISTLHTGLQILDGSALTGIINPLDDSLTATWLGDSSSGWFLYKGRETSKTKTFLTNEPEAIWALSGSGDAQFAYSNVSGTRVVVGNKAWTVPSGVSLAQRVHQKGDDYVLHIYYEHTDKKLVNLVKGTELVIETEACGVCIGDGQIFYYVRSENSIKVIDISSMTLIDTIPLAFAYPFSSTPNRFSAAAYDNGIYWMHVDIYHHFWGIDVATGNLFYDLDRSLDPITCPCIKSRDGILAVADKGSLSQEYKVLLYKINDLDIVETTLADIVSAECALTGLISPADIDVSLLTQTVRGFTVSESSARASIELLQGVYMFDMVQNGYKLKFVPRGQAPVMTISGAQLGAVADGSPENMLVIDREMDSQLPSKVTVKFLDASIEYGTNAQSSPERTESQANNTETIEAPLSLTPDEATQLATKIWALRWNQKNTYQTVLPPTYSMLIATDVVLFDLPYGKFEMQISEINYEVDGRMNVKGFSNFAPSYSSSSPGAWGVIPDGTVAWAGPSLLVMLDIPMVDENLQASPSMVAAMCGYGQNWPGGIVTSSSDAGQTWIDLQGFTGPSSIGTCLTKLAITDSYLIDPHTLQVSMLAGVPESITRDLMLLGANYAAYGMPGRWEIVRFQTSIVQTDGTYMLSNFVRGDRGTEWATGLHELGDYFILLEDPDNALIGLSYGDISLPKVYKGVTSGGSIDDAASIALTYQGVNFECLSPFYPLATRDGSGNLSVTFVRRSRYVGTWWVNGAVSPLGESTEAYQIDILDALGTTVKRTISSTTEAFSYSAANQTTDFGSPQSAIKVKIYQMSSVVGRGYPREATL